MNIVKCELCGSTLNAEQAAKYERQRDAARPVRVQRDLEVLDDAAIAVARGYIFVNVNDEVLKRPTCVSVMT